jgi:hypothetical protein
MKEGMKENAAEEKAVDEMGDPVEVGKSFNQLHRTKIFRFDVIGNIIMWGIAGGIVLFGAIFGIGIAWSMFLSGNRIIGIIVGGGLTTFGIFIALAFFTLCKGIANELFYYSLLRDYKRRKKRGQLYLKY